jgi:hypothetical protein
MNVDESFSDIAQHLTFGGMLLSEARTGRSGHEFQRSQPAAPSS